MLNQDNTHTWLIEFTAVRQIFAVVVSANNSGRSIPIFCSNRFGGASEGKERPIDRAERKGKITVFILKAYPESVY
jgi:hypothetical protein